MAFGLRSRSPVFSPKLLPSLLMFLLVVVLFSVVVNKWGYLSDWGLAVCESEMDSGVDGYLERVNAVAAYEHCIRELAKKRGDYRICDNLDGVQETEYCYFHVFSTLEDGGRCGEVESLLLKDYCLQYVAEGTSDPSLCQEIVNATPRDLCFTRLAGNLDNLSLCYQVSDPSKAGNCVAWLADDAGDCMRFDGRLHRDYCTHLFDVRWPNQTWCGRIVDDTLRDSCHLRRGYYYGNASVCGLIGDGDSRNLCYAYALHETRYCDAVADVYDRDYCYCKIYPWVPGVGVCDKISESELANSCYSGKAMTTANTTLCEKIKDDRFWCYVHAARYNQNKSLCNRLTREKKQSCLEWANLA